VLLVSWQSTHREGHGRREVQKKNCDLKHRNPVGFNLTLRMESSHTASCIYTLARRVPGALDQHHWIVR
jgi:hypothetical protein